MENPSSVVEIVKPLEEELRELIKEAKEMCKIFYQIQVRRRLPSGHWENIQRYELTLLKDNHVQKRLKLFLDNEDKVDYIRELHEYVEGLLSALINVINYLHEIYQNQDVTITVVAKSNTPSKVYQSKTDFIISATDSYDSEPSDKNCIVKEFNEELLSNPVPNFNVEVLKEVNVKESYKEEPQKDITIESIEEAIPQTALEEGSEEDAPSTPSSSSQSYIEEQFKLDISSMRVRKISTNEHQNLESRLSSEHQMESSPKIFKSEINENPNILTQKANLQKDSTKQKYKRFIEVTPELKLFNNINTLKRKLNNPASKKSKLSPTTAIQKARSLESDLLVIGSNGTTVPKSCFDKINWNSPAVATRKLLSIIFDDVVLATSTLSGNPSPAFYGRERAPKGQLDPLKVADIIEHVCLKCNVSKQLVRAAITTKCADTTKKIRRKLPQLLS